MNRANSLTPEEVASRTPLLEQAIHDIQNALSGYDKIFADFDKDGKKVKWQVLAKPKWYGEIRGLAGREYQICNEILPQLRAMVKEARVADRGRALFIEAHQKVAEAEARGASLQKRFDNIQEVVEGFYEIAELYERAASLFSATITALPGLGEADQLALIQYIENCQNRAEEYRRAGSSWPQQVEEQMQNPWYQVIGLIQGYLNEEFEDFSALVTFLKEAFDEAQIIDEAFIEEWSVLWGLLDEHRLAQGEDFHKSRAIDDLIAMRNFLFSRK